MSDEPSSSAAQTAAVPPTVADGDEQSNPVPTAGELAARRKNNRETFNRKRGDLLDDVLRNLDILIYAELSTIYYLDCYFLRFLIRAFVQFVFLTPKPPMFPQVPPNRPYVAAIFGSNFLCIILHALSNAPSAGEATRGYLHGGLAMDFIGQKGPTNKTHLIILDLIVVVLQVTHLAAHVVRQRLKDGHVSTNTPAAEGVGNAPVQSQGQTVDDEERGVRRSTERQQREDIEMQTLNPAGRTPATEENPNEAESSDREALLATMSTPTRTDAHIFDAFSSGQVVLADLNLGRTIREQFWAYQKATYDPNSAEANRELRQRLTGRVMRWRLDTGPGTPFA